MRRGAMWWLLIGWWWYLLVGWWWWPLRWMFRRRDARTIHKPPTTEVTTRSRAPTTTSKSSEPFTIHLITDTAKTSDGLECKGFQPYFDEDGQTMLPLDELVPEAPGVFYARVAGAGHHSREIQRQCFSAGAPVDLVPEPDNPVDPNAVLVVAVDGAEKRVGGYLPAELAAEVPKNLRRTGGDGIVVQTFTKGGQRVGLRIVGTFGTKLDVRYVNN